MVGGDDELLQKKNFNSIAYEIDVYIVVVPYMSCFALKTLTLMSLETTRTHIKLRT
jgi:hypothetical protein